MVVRVVLVHRHDHRRQRLWRRFAANAKKKIGESKKISARREGRRKEVTTSGSSRSGNSSYESQLAAPFSSHPLPSTPLHSCSRHLINIMPLASLFPFPLLPLYLRHRLGHAARWNGGDDLLPHEGADAEEDAPHPLLHVQRSGREGHTAYLHDQNLQGKRRGVSLLWR